MAVSGRDWPGWWEWEFDFSNPHIRKRMVDRRFSETDVRAALGEASEWYPDAVEGRFVIVVSMAGSRWEVIVEPDADDKVVVVVTAYPVQ